MIRFGLILFLLFPVCAFGFTLYPKEAETYYELAEQYHYGRGGVVKDLIKSKEYLLKTIEVVPKGSGLYRDAMVGIGNLYKVAIVGLGFQIFVDYHLIAVLTRCRFVVDQSFVVDVIKKGEVVAVKLQRRGRGAKACDVEGIEICNIL